MVLNPLLHRRLNTLALAGISFILSITLLLQWFYYELPCPLCLLQRIAFVGIGVSLCMNICLRIHPIHYGLMLLSALFGFLVAWRQIFINSGLGVKSYGVLFFHLHLYTWSAIGFLIILVMIGFIFLVDRNIKASPLPGIQPFARFIMIFFLAIIFINSISAFIECGWMPCPDNPTDYQLLRSKN